MIFLLFFIHFYRQFWFLFYFENISKATLDNIRNVQVRSCNISHPVAERNAIWGALPVFFVFFFVSFYRTWLGFVIPIDSGSAGHMCRLSQCFEQQASKLTPAATCVLVCRSRLLFVCKSFVPASVVSNSLLDLSVCLRGIFLESACTKERDKIVSHSFGGRSNFVCLRSFLFRSKDYEQLLVPILLRNISNTWRSHALYLVSYLVFEYTQLTCVVSFFLLDREFLPPDLIHQYNSYGQLCGSVG